MKLMGRHSPPIDGKPVMNGFHLTPFAVPPAAVVQPLGPVSGWPQAPVDDVEGPGWWARQRAAVKAHGKLWRACLSAVPVVLVNAVAFGAQLGFWQAHLHNLTEAILVALALESIAIYLSWQAHLAQLADDSALRLRLSAYGMALGIGALNFSHYCGPDWRPTVPAVTFGMMSAISPWLWSVHSRRESRDALKARGLIEAHAVRLGLTRWAWHPVRSVRVMSRAAWTGETDPSAAIASWAPRAAAEAPSSLPESRHEAPVEPVMEAPVIPPSEPATERPVNGARKPVKTVAGKQSAQEKAATGLKRYPDLSDAKIGEKVGVSEATVRRVRIAAKESE